MPNLILLPSDFDQRCKRYRAYLEKISLEHVVDAAWRAPLEQERERIGLSREDARAVEQEYLRANIVTLLTRMGTRLNEAEGRARELETWRASTEKRTQETQTRLDRAERQLTQRQADEHGSFRKLQTRLARVEEDARNSQTRVAHVERRVSDLQTQLTDTNRPLQRLERQTDRQPVTAGPDQEALSSKKDSSKIEYW